MAIKSINALTATSSTHSRSLITFDDTSGLILSIDHNVSPAKEADYFYSDDCLLFAGMGDIHIHAREDVSQKNIYKEDFTSTTAAALNGGVVFVADMPNNPIAPVDDGTYLQKCELTQKHAIPILLYAGIGPKTRALSFKVPYKVYMGPSIGELYFKSNQELDEVMPYYRDQVVSFHCEDPEILEACKTQMDHYSKRPLKAEIMATQTAIALIEKYNLTGKLCHYSAGEGLLAIKAAKNKGLKISCEVTPQHLYFSEEDILDMPLESQVHFQMNPPIRQRREADALLDALKKGEIDYLATDHAPHSPEEKGKGMSGLPGLDTFAPFVTWLIVTQKVAPSTIALIACENPGLFLNQFLPSLKSRASHFEKWGAGMGFIAPGFSASFTILNFKKPVTITSQSLKTKACWSPFLGVTFPGSLEAVFLAGKLVQKETCPNI